MAARANLFSRFSPLAAMLLAASAILPLYALTGLEIDNSMEVWLHRDGDEYAAYREFLGKYGSEEFVVVALDTEDPFSPESIQVQRDLAERLKCVSGVRDVLDLPTAAGAMWGKPTEWKRQAKNNDVFENLLLGPDGRTVGLFVFLKPLPGPASRRNTVTEIKKVAHDAAGRRFPLHFAGTPLLNVELDQGSLQASRLFLPMAMALCVVVLVVMLRSFRRVIVCMLAVGAGVAWTMGIMVWAGRTLNMVTAVLPALLFVLALSGGIHLCSRFAARLAECGNPAQAARQALGELLRPLLLTSLTTAVGFASLMISDMQPVRDFGMFAAVGMLLAFVCNAGIIPGLLVLLHRGPGRHPRAIRPHWSGRSGAVIARSRWRVVLPATVLLAGCVVAAFQTRAESNVLKFFPEESSIAQDYAFVGQRLTGFYTVEIDVTADARDEPRLVAALTRLAGTIGKRPEVARAVHAGEFLSLRPDFSALARSPDELLASVRLLQQMALRYRHAADGKVSLRMSVLVRAIGSAEFYPLLEYLHAQVATELGPAGEYRITGIVPLINDVQRSLVNTQIRSFGIAAAAVLIMIALFFLSPMAGLAALLPNLLPVFAMFALMAAAGIALDSATVMIASVAIGIAADDTIHFLSQYRRAVGSSADIPAAASATLGTAGRAMFCTSVVAAAGFAILCLASFRPIVYFGLLAGVTMLTALAADLFVLPACVNVLRLWRKK